MRGRVVGDTVTITRFVAIPQSATKSSVTYLLNDAVTEKHAAASDEFIGSIHSHPGTDMDAAPSVADWKSSFDCGDIVSAIMVVEPRANGTFRTEIRFWPALPPIAIVHPRTRPPKKKLPSIKPDTMPDNVHNNLQTEPI